MAGVASYFLPTATGLGEFTNRSGNVALSLETQVWSPVSASSHAPIDIPIVILTSDRTSSAAEILVAALKDAKRATVIGAETCGCVLAIRSRHALPDGGQLDVSELDYRTAQHVRLEGHGIMPDENIILSRRDLYSGRDRVLGSALARLKGRAAGEKPIPPLASYPDQDKLQEMLASGLMFNSISLYNILVDSESSGAKFEAKGMKKIRDRPAYAGSR
jgi:C-terminal processing protease CtpA/Prc